MTGLSRIADLYHAQGLVVIPVRGKRPAVRWYPFVVRLPKEDERRDFPWDRATGLALILGPATWASWPFLWCLTIELQHRAAAEAWLDRHVPEWRAGVVAEDGGGGLHLYFRASRPVITREIRWGEVRGQGAVCTVPPALDPNTGGRCRWVGGAPCSAGGQAIPGRDGTGWREPAPLEPEVIPGYLGDGAPAERSPGEPARTSPPPAPLVPITELLKDDADTDEAAWLPVLGQDGLVARGAATLLSSRPKAGKSTLLAHCTRQWLAAGLVVAWLTEEPTAVWRQRRRMLPQLNTDRLFLGFPSLGTTAEAWLTALRDVRPDVIIVDTLRAFMGIADENDAAVVHHRLTPWVLLARELDAALVLSHHRNKMGGEEGIDHAGSHAFVGAVDVAISLREVADAPRRRQLVCRSRFETTPAALLVELEEGGAYRVLGEPAEVAFTEVRERVREALTGEWQTRDEVYAALADPKPNREYVRRALHSLVAAGLAERQAGRGNTPDRWRAVDPAHPVHPSPTGINVVDHDGVGRMDMVGAAHDTADAAGIGGCDSGNSLTPPELLCSSTDSWEEQGDAAARLLTLLSLAEAAGWPRLPIRPGVVVAPGEACWRRFARTAPVDDLRAAQAALAALVSMVSTVSSGTDPDLDGEGDLADLADLADLPF